MIGSLDDNSSIVFSGETNPYKRQKASSDSYSIFGKKIKKKSLGEIMNALAGAGDDGEEEGSYTGSISAVANPQKAGLPTYSAGKLYGGLFNMYGGRKLKGGLLGD